MRLGTMVTTFAANIAVDVNEPRDLKRGHGAAATMAATQVAGASLRMRPMYQGPRRS